MALLHVTSPLATETPLPRQGALTLGRLNYYCLFDDCFMWNSKHTLHIRKVAQSLLGTVDTFVEVVVVVAAGRVLRVGVWTVV